MRINPGMGHAKQDWINTTHGRFQRSTLGSRVITAACCSEYPVTRAQAFGEANKRTALLF